MLCVGPATSGRGPPISLKHSLVSAWRSGEWVWVSGKCLLTRGLGGLGIQGTLVQDAPDKPARDLGDFLGVNKISLRLSTLWHVCIHASLKLSENFE